ncbi:outer membrane protein [Deinococcus metalli]|uniref:Outer membrane protein n=1 Tax=Deinococcus metalli TaxID=1141878 RepID=A0A7W8KFQ1_9DEIO|nr:OmpH family outer membrane protein [Deinococcus metalli]MBB5377070.1 outer membrane protein [Deinococcus metalli]GHF49192.1 cationic outer membrane protein OmpH [Deinococcus metalli]
MNRILILLPLALLATVPRAQQPKPRVAFVNVDTLVKAMPNNAAYVKVMTQADTDLKAKRAAIQTLAAKASASGSAADRQAVTKAQQAYTTLQADYTKKLQTAFAPLSTKLNAAVAQAAKANGFAIVMDEKVAAQTQLVLYADKGTSLTAAVQKLLK